MPVEVDTISTAFVLAITLPLSVIYPLLWAIDMIDNAMMYD